MWFLINNFYTHSFLVPPEITEDPHHTLDYVVFNKQLLYTFIPCAARDYRRPHHTFDYVFYNKQLLHIFIPFAARDYRRPHHTFDYVVFNKQLLYIFIPFAQRLQKTPTIFLFKWFFKNNFYIYSFLLRRDYRRPHHTLIMWFLINNFYLYIFIPFAQRLQKTPTHSTPLMLDKQTMCAHIDARQHRFIVIWYNTTQIAKFMGPTWGPPGSCQPQMGPMLAPWTLLSGNGLTT